MKNLVKKVFLTVSVAAISPLISTMVIETRSCTEKCIAECGSQKSEQAGFSRVCDREILNGSNVYVCVCRDKLR
jgi:hypothetical protein